MSEFDTIYKAVPDLDPKGAPDAFLAAVPEGGFLTTEGFGRFLHGAFSGCSDEEFETKVMRAASAHAEAVAEKRKKVPDADLAARSMQWAERLIGVFDIDGNGTLEEGEF